MTQRRWAEIVTWRLDPFRSHRGLAAPSTTSRHYVMPNVIGGVPDLLYREGRGWTLGLPSWWWSVNKVEAVACPDQSPWWGHDWCRFSRALPRWSSVSIAACRNTHGSSVMWRRSGLSARLVVVGVLHRVWGWPTMGRHSCSLMAAYTRHEMKHLETKNPPFWHIKDVERCSTWGIE
jgi:hypothetical protein